MYLSPLGENKKRLFRGNQVFIQDVDTGEICVQDLSKAMEVPILTVSIDQGGVGAVSYQQSLEDFQNHINLSMI
jgi:hypothetical protein